MTQPKMIKIAADGAQLPDDATEWVAVFLPEHDITFTKTSVVDSDVPHEQCEAACKALTLAGHSDWDLPTIDELQLLVDRTRYSPAAYVDYFQIESDWYWSKTPAKWSEKAEGSFSAAWFVLFSLGYVSSGLRGNGGFALACRRAGVPVSSLILA
ncbi:Lcl C-terminal domain-containing protein [Marilutibacter alkalisoli]|uniref:DUF1566 domain-containing protein n=1 Tax=Marilutibacter alkalisoli TaxID=2591633 RepID=A0A514BU22_9GAMM|nr:DUF1566 domain-containing protein [Lysobacter alkalisoli]QDH70880.1 DUF1566 domain-containing protein [Lysobacter alkalisoli]